MSPVIQLDRVTMKFSQPDSAGSVTALDGISFDVSSAEVCAFVGPNGAGKTTAINLLMGFRRAQAGTVRVLDSFPGDVRAKRDIGFLAERPAFHGYLTVRQLLQFHAALLRYPDQTARQTAAALLDRFGLDKIANRKVSSLSRGTLQRLGIAQALLGKPRLVILDEPTSALDPINRVEFRALVRDLRANGTTVFISSHILSELEPICSKVIIIHKGQVKLTGSLDLLCRAHKTVVAIAARITEDGVAAVLGLGGSVESSVYDVTVKVPARSWDELKETLDRLGSPAILVREERGSLESLFMESVKNGTE